MFCFAVSSVTARAHGQEVMQHTRSCGVGVMSTILSMSILMCPMQNSGGGGEGEVVFSQHAFTYMQRNGAGCFAFPDVLMLKVNTQTCWNH